MADTRTQDEWQKIIDDVHSKLPKDASQFPTYPVPKPGSLEFAKLIDHTLLKLDATPEQIDALCDEARKYQFKVGGT